MAGRRRMARVNLIPAPRLRRRLLVRQDVAGVLGGGWVDGDVPFVDVLNDPVFVDHKGRAITKALLLVKNSIVLNYRALEIAEKRESNAILFGEFAIGGNTIYAESENLRVGRFEFGDI